MSDYCCLIEPIDEPDKQILTTEFHRGKNEKLFREVIEKEFKRFITHIIKEEAL